MIKFFVGFVILATLTVGVVFYVTKHTLTEQNKVDVSNKENLLPQKTVTEGVFAPSR